MFQYNLCVWVLFLITTELSGTWTPNLPFHPLATVSRKKFLLILTEAPWHSLRLFSLVLGAQPDPHLVLCRAWTR